jgi:hypothetical protein
MKNFSRHFEVERASVDPEAGTFEAVLFTDGEASDGHILNIGGGKIPERMPLFVNHSSDPTTQLGSLHYVESTEHKVRVRGQVLTEGVGAPLEVRQDLLVKMAAGHVSRMSGRWDAEDKNIKRRINLPSDHPAFVDDSKESESRRRWGLYFDKWTAMEGSVVGLGADPQAVMRWANDGEASEPVRAFWREQISEAQEAGVLANLSNAAREALSAGITPEAIGECVSGVVPVGALTTVTFASTGTFAVDEDGAVNRIDDDETGEDREEIEAEIEALGEALGARIEAGIESSNKDITTRLDALEGRLSEMESAPTPSATEEPERVEPDEPLPSIETPREVTAALRTQLRAARREVMEELRVRLAAARGKVDQ